MKIFLLKKRRDFITFQSCITGWIFAGRALRLRENILLNFLVLDYFSNSSFECTPLKLVKYFSMENALASNTLTHG